MRIKVINNEIGIGAAKSRNLASSISKGRFIAFLDADDFWTSSKLEKQINFMMRNGYEFTYAYYDVLNKNGETHLLKAPFKINKILMMFICPISCQSVIYDTKDIGIILSEDLKKRNDYALWIKILKKTKNAYCLRESVGTYRMGDHGLSSNKLENLKYYWKIMFMFYSKYLVFLPLTTSIYLFILSVKKFKPAIYNRLF